MFKRMEVIFRLYFLIKRERVRERVPFKVLISYQVHGSSYDVSCVDDLPVVGCAYQPQVLSVCTCHGDLSDVTLHQNEADKTEDPNTLSQSKASIKQGQLGSLPQSKNKLFKRKTAR